MSDNEDSSKVKVTLTKGAGVRIVGCTLTAIITSILVALFFPEEFESHYDRIRSDLFNAAFVVAGLLLAMKTYILIKMEEGVYQKPSYIKLFAVRKGEENADNSHLDPLRRLAKIINLSIIFLGVAAIAQLFNGTIPGLVEPVFAITLLGAAFGVSWACWNEMQKNLESYFTHLEVEAEPKIREIQEDLNKQKEKHGLIENS